MYSILLILTLIIISGVIAYIGDLTGFRIGKKKISIFGWRPHRTAVFITILTGIIISILTITVLSILSNDVRTALFGLDELRERQCELTQEIKVRNTMLEETRKELEEKTLERDSLQQEIVELQETVKALYSGISWLRSGDIIIDQGEEIAMTIIKGGIPEDQIEQELKNLLNQANRKVLELGAEPDEKTGQILIISKREYDEVIEKIQQSDGELIVHLFATMNVIRGEMVIANFSILQNKLVFKENEVILVEEIPVINEAKEAENRLFSILRKVNLKAVQEGIIPELRTSLVGTISAVNLFEMVRTIVQSETALQIKVIALDDTWTTGPLRVRMEAEKILH
jgi:uncharacterized protein (DUF3084 family)